MFLVFSNFDFQFLTMTSRGGQYFYRFSSACRLIEYNCSNVVIAEIELEPFIDTNIDQLWSTVTTHLQIKELTTFQEFVTFDEDISSSGLYTDADIIASVST